MEKKLIDLVADTLRMNYVYSREGFLRDHLFFQDAVLMDNVALKMQSSYFVGRQKGLYGVVREFDERKPVIDLFFLHGCFASDIYQDNICFANLGYIQGGDMRVPLEDPLTSEEVTRSLFDGTYKPLIDERPELNASWVRIKPFYSFTNKNEVYETALECSMKHVRNFLEMYQPLKRLFVDVDFAVHDPTLFSRFLVGAEFSFEDNTLGSLEIIERAKEVYGNFRV